MVVASDHTEVAREQERASTFKLQGMSTLPRAGLGLPVLVDVVVRKNKTKSHLYQELRVAGKRHEQCMSLRT